MKPRVTDEEVAEIVRRVEAMHGIDGDGDAQPADMASAGLAHRSRGKSGAVAGSRPMRTPHTAPRRISQWTGEVADRVED